MIQLRDALIVAWFDLWESMRSRKALALLVLYLAGALAAAGIFVTVLREIESAVADTLLVSATDKPGAMTSSLMESQQFLDIVSGLIGDADLAAELVTIPPLALFYGWLSLTFVPVLATFTSSDAISSERSSGSARYVLFRTERFTWAAGKYLGQALLLAAGVALGGVGVWVVGAASMASFEGPETAAWLLRLGLRTWVYGVAWLGLALGCSQLTRSVGGTRALALLALFGMGVGRGLTVESPLHEWLREKGAESVSIALSSVGPLFPGHHQLDLWRPDAAARAPAILMLLALGSSFFSLGYAWMRRRDL